MFKKMSQSFYGLTTKEMEKKYRIYHNEVLGKGAFSEVKKAVGKQDGTEYAVKLMNKATLSHSDLKTLYREVDILRKLDWTNIIKLYDVYEDFDTVYLFTEFASGGELFERIVEKERYEEEDAKNVVRRLAFALRHCFKKGIIHRDLKPDNILLSDDTDDSVIKLADFGFATAVNPESADHKILQTQLGTPNYIAPEIINGKTYNYKCDIWSFGVITYVLLSGHLPFGGKSRSELFKHIKAGVFTFTPSFAWSNVSEEAKDFIRHLIVVDPDKRYDYDQIISHEWVASNKQDRSDLTGNLKNLEMFSAKKREIAANMKAHEAALIMEDLMFGFGMDGEDEEDEEEASSGSDDEVESTVKTGAKSKRKTMWELLVGGGTRKGSVKG